jgi:hypothetical protein
MLVPGCSCRASRIAAASNDDLAGIKTYASLVVIEFGALVTWKQIAA